MLFIDVVKKHLVNKKSYKQIKKFIQILELFIINNQILLRPFCFYLIEGWMGVEFNLYNPFGFV